MMISFAQALYAAGMREILKSRFEMKTWFTQRSRTKCCSELRHGRSIQVDFRNGILFGQHHSAISKIIGDFSAEDCSVVLSIENGSLRAAENRSAWSMQSRTKAAANALERDRGMCQL
jgi:hypothetical protein